MLDCNYNSSTLEADTKILRNFVAAAILVSRRFFFREIFSRI